MSTTTIRLPQELKARVAAAAQRAGTTPHSFIVQAIAEKADAVERQNEFVAEAEARYAAVVASGKTISWREMRAYLEKRSTGARARRPKARKLGR